MIKINEISLFVSLGSLLIAFLSFKRNENKNIRIEGKNEGLIVQDIAYIKSCVDRMEKNMSKVDERYQNILERLIVVEEAIKKGGGNNEF